jgi:hypothetical protein
MLNFILQGGVNDNAFKITFSNNLEKWKSYANRLWYASVIDSACTKTGEIIFDHLGEFEAEFKMAFVRNHGA